MPHTARPRAAALPWAKPRTWHLCPPSTGMFASCRTSCRLRLASSTFFLLGFKIPTFSLRETPCRRMLCCPLPWPLLCAVQERIQACHPGQPLANLHCLKTLCACLHESCSADVSTSGLGEAHSRRSYQRSAACSEADRGGGEA